MSTHGLPHRPRLSRPVVNGNGIFFWCLGNGVRVRFTFFLVGLLAAGRGGVAELLVWEAVVFVGVLLHELGHAQAARRYGADPSIELYAMGGLTSWSWARPPTLSQRLVTSLAGPGAGFLTGGLIGLVARLAPGGTDWPYLIRLAIDDFVWISLGWGIFNLLPMLPLDGGSAMDALLQAWLGSGRGRHMARLASCGLGVLGFLWGFAYGYRWAAMLCALFAYDNFTRLRAEGITRRAEGPGAPV
jgi:stage IV sporulation protein FB